MNPLRFLSFLALPLLALCAANVALTAEEQKHVEGDPAVTHFVIFDVSVYKSATEVERLGEMKFALFGEHLPITVASFITKTEQTIDGYTNSVLHRVVKDAIVQGGYLKRTDWKEYDVLQYEKFPCEKFDIKHNKAGRISLASTGGNTNGCLFFISTSATTSFFDGKYVAFGQLVLGFDVMKKLNEVKVNGETPVDELIITRAVYTDPSSIPMVMDFRAVTAEYLYFIYFCVGVVVLYGLYRLKGRRAVVELKSFKM